MSKEKVTEMIKQELGDVEVKFVSVKKNNVERDGCIVSRENDTIMPTVYYNPHWSNDRIADHIIKAYNSADGIVVDMEKFFNRDYILENAFPQIVKRDGNGYIEGKLHKDFLDFAILYRVSIGNDQSYLVTESIAERFNISLDEVDQAAMRNVKENACIINMCDFLGNNTDDVNMLILTNNKKMFGASAILSSDILVEAADKIGCDYYIIPSSIHECLAVSTEDIDKDSLANMICTVNATQVSEVVLFDKPLIYERETGRLTIA